MYGAAQYLKQKYMGVSYDSRSYDRYSQIAINGQAGHDLPLTNFLNAQCTSLLSILNTNLFFRFCDYNTWYPTSRIQSRSRYRKFQSLGSFIKMYFHRLFSPFKIRFFSIFLLQEEWYRIRNSIWKWKSLWFHKFRYFGFSWNGN